MFRTLIDLMKENGFTLTKARSRRCSTQTITDARYVYDIALLANISTPVESLLHSLERAAGGILLCSHNHNQSQQYYKYIFRQKQANTNTKYRRTLLLHVRTVLLISDFSSSTRGERQFLKVFRNHTMLTTPPTFGTSRGVWDLNSSSLVGTRKT